MNKKLVKSLKRVSIILILILVSEVLFIGYHLLYNIASSSISEATGAGYGGQPDTDDYDELYAYYFDGYYWEYLGYYA